MICPSPTIHDGLEVGVTEGRRMFCVVVDAVNHWIQGQWKQVATSTAKAKDR